MDLLLVYIFVSWMRNFVTLPLGGGIIRAPNVPSDRWRRRENVHIAHLKNTQKEFREKKYNY